MYQGGGGGCTGLTTVVNYAPVKTDTTVDFLGSLCDDVETTDDTETPTAAAVAR